MERSLRNLVIVLGEGIDHDERAEIGRRTSAIRRGEVVADA
jgi:hypothetical protein